MADEVIPPVCGEWLAILVVPGADLLSDVLLIADTFHDMYPTSLLYKVGLWIWISAHVVRTMNEGVAYQVFLGANKWKGSCSMFSPCNGFSILIERFCRLALIFVDPIISLGAMGKSGECKSLLTTRLYWMTTYECQLIENQSLCVRYSHLVAAAAGGGRWLADYVTTKMLPDILGRLDAMAIHHRKDLKYTARVVCALALLEELLQNCGGILLSSAVILQKGQATNYAIFSLVASGISTLYETGYLIETFSLREPTPW